MDELAMFEAARPDLPMLTDADRNRLWARIVEDIETSGPDAGTTERSVGPARSLDDALGDLGPDDGLDVLAVARRGHRERRIRRLLTVAAATTVLVGGLGLWRIAGPDANGQPSSPSDLPDTLPSATTSEPVGSLSLAWSQLATADFALDDYSFIGSLPDGRTVLWNGTEAMENVTAQKAVGIAFYDAATDEWSRSSTFPAEQLWGNDAEIVGGSVIVHQYMSDGSRDRFARYDLATDTWTVSADLPDDRIVLEWAADDTTIAAWTYQLNVSPSRVLMRSTADGTWAPGAPTPFTERTQEGTAHQGGRLAVYGGLSDSPSNAVPFPTEEAGTATLGLGDARPYAAIDGGIYDVSTDTWSLVPVSPLAGVAFPEVVLDGSTVVVAGGAPAVSSVGYVQQLGTYDVTLNQWNLSSFDPAWRGGAVGLTAGVLMAQNPSGYLVSIAPYQRWTPLPVSDIQNSWQPIPIGPNEYLLAAHSAGVVSFQIIRDGITTDAPPVPWPTSPETGYASTFIPTTAGVIVIDGVSHEPWLLSTR